MKKQLSERELIELQIQTYEFYAGLIDRAVGGGTHEAHLPRWDEQRAQEYRELAEQLRRRLAELDAQAAAAPATTPVPVVGAPATPAQPATPDPATADQQPEAAMVSDAGGTVPST